MGTNYYLKPNVCERCGRGEERIHIGKASAGWKFCFREYREDWRDFKIKSVAEWRSVIAIDWNEIEDEYGHGVLKCDFWGMVERKQGDQWDGVNTPPPNDNRHQRHRDDHCYLDPEGYRMDDSEFC